MFTLTLTLTFEMVNDAKKHIYEKTSKLFMLPISCSYTPYFKDKKDFTISLRTGVYRDTSRNATRLYTLSQIIFDKIRMQEVDLDHEGVKKILLVEITRNIKNAQLTKWESTTDVKKYESLLKIA